MTREPLRLCHTCGHVRHRHYPCRYDLTDRLARYEADRQEGAYA